jgi:hypothetical protein
LTAILPKKMVVELVEVVAAATNTVKKMLQKMHDGYMAR